MPKKPTPDDPIQSKRFIDMAREVEAAETKEEAEKAFKKIVGSEPKSPKPTRG